MACSCCDFTSAAGQQFTAKKAAKELRGYRRGRLGPTTRLLRDSLLNTRLNRGTLLDIGAGVGALTFELLEHGVASAVAVDASSAYLAAAQEEASRRNRSQSIAFVHGDFVNVAGQLSPADVVTLDRVVCCYADYTSLLSEAVRRAERAFAFSYPRDRWFVRLGLGVENAMRRVRSNAFRTFVHPVADMQRLIAKAGFELVHQSQTSTWAVEIHTRYPGLST
jgi:SAM-dependent methyltransferase